MAVDAPEALRNGITPAMRRLPDLPDELLVQILELLPSQRDLGALCQVSHRVNAVADPVLYKSIRFDQPKHHMTFSESLSTRPRRGSLIQNVRLEYPSSELSDIMCLRDSSPSRIDHFSHTISTMSNLEKLVISVPESLSHGIGTLFNGPFDLACLKSCDLFYQREDGGYWDLQENIHIFSHPTLEHLTIRRAKLDQRGFECLEQPSETPLRELHLIECDINDDALSDILLFPEALRVFTMTQLRVPMPPLEESSKDVGDYILAMNPVQHSLETIKLDLPTMGASSAMRLRAFESLKYLELRDFQLLGQPSNSPRLHSVGLPPNLQTLRFLSEVTEDEEILELLCYTLENIDVMARKLRELWLVRGEHGLPARIIDACRISVGFDLEFDAMNDDDSSTVVLRRSPPSPPHPTAVKLLEVGIRTVEISA